MTTWIRGSVCALVLALGLCAALAQTETAAHEALLARLNYERARAGLPPLRLVPVLVQLAQQQAEEMVQGGRRLRSPSGKTVSERLERVGYAAHDWRQYFALSDEPPEAVSLDKMPALWDGHFRDLGVGTAVVNGSRFHVFVLGWHQGDYFAEATARLGDRSRIAAEMLARVNEIRRQAGLPPLAPNALLDRVSQKHAEDMLARSYSGHHTPEGWNPTDRAQAAGYRSGIGENIVEQRFSTEEALRAWLGSPGHRKNILDPGCRELGLGLAIGKGFDTAPGGYRVIWVQSFGGGASAPFEAPSAP